MVYDPASTTSSPPMSSQPLDDVPPSYDSIASFTPPTAEGSRRWPANMDDLFSGPPNPEPLIGREQAAALDINIRSVSGKTESWDKKLNDPSVLYNFIRTQALEPPRFKIRCSAGHTETAQRTETVMENGTHRVVHSGQTYRVVDFDFIVDLSPVYNHEDNVSNVTLTAVGSHIPVRRGTFSPVFGPNSLSVRESERRSASWNEISLWQAWATFIYERGRAPWASMQADEEFQAQYGVNQPRGIFLGSGTDEEMLIGGPQNEGNDISLRQWCDIYCADPGLLKSFTLDKWIWGWDFANLKLAILRAILSTGYQPSEDIIIALEPSGAQVTVRPDNLLVKAVYNPFCFFLLCITFIYPFIWIWQRLHYRGGCPYEVASARYGMKVYPPLPSTYPEETVEDARSRLPALFKLHPEIPRAPLLQRGPKGIHYLLGRREGEWFREWEERIRMGVRMRFQGELVNTRVNEDEEPPELDGY